MLYMQTYGQDESPGLSFCVIASLDQPVPAGR